MMKKIISACVVLALALTAVGCACRGAVVAPSPTLSAKPVTTPQATGGAMTPGMAETPGAQTSPGEATSPDLGGTIENFKEGTEVKVEDAPDVKKAITDKYPNATISKITHALVKNAQVYAVEIKDGTTSRTVYVKPDGTILETTGS